MATLTDLVARPMVLEVGVFALLVLVLVSRWIGSSGTGRRAGWITLAGLVLLALASGASAAGGQAFGGTFVQDDLAVFAKTLFLVSAALSVLAGLGLGSEALSR